MNGLISGSFDPVTNGHLDLIRRAAMLCGRLTVVIAYNSEKKGCFPLGQRLEWLEESVRLLGKENIECVAFDGLTVEAARRYGADVLIRGARNSQDFIYEQNIASMNSLLDPSLETIILFSGETLSWVSSSNVRELLRYGQDIRSLVPEPVWKSLEERRNG